MKKVTCSVSPLPERYRFVNSNVPPNVDILHFLAFFGITIINNIEVAKSSANVVGEINSVSGITTCCSPVSGMTLQGSHSC